MENNLDRTCLLKNDHTQRQTELGALAFFNCQEHRQCGENLTLLEQNPYGIMACDPPPELLDSALTESGKVAAP